MSSGWLGNLTLDNYSACRGEFAGADSEGFLCKIDIGPVDIEVDYWLAGSKACRST